MSKYALYTNFLRSLTNQENESTLKDDFRLFLRVPGIKNAIFRRPNAIRWAAENFFFGALGPHLHGFFGLFLKWPSFPYNFLSDTSFFLFFAESVDKHVENIPAKGFQKLSFYSWDKLAEGRFYINGTCRSQNVWVLRLMRAQIRILRKKWCCFKKKSTSIRTTVRKLFNFKDFDTCG